MSKAIILAETTVNETNMGQALEALGAPEWISDAYSSAEALAEFAGRLCYKSFAPLLNPNVTKVREGNKDYLANILKQFHGSVIEHASVSVVFIGVSRIFTHELVRHRIASVSQESQRYVRLDKFELYIPDLTEGFQEIAAEIGESPQWVQEQQLKFIHAVDMFSKFGEEKITQLIRDYMLDDPRVKFHAKKQITSAIRRLLPAGVNTNILLTTNHREWRHIFTKRGGNGAEQEIAEIIPPLALTFQSNYPAIYQDMTVVDGQVAFQYTGV